MQSSLYEFAPQETLKGRSFTDPSYSGRDLADLQYMFGALCQLVCEPDKIPPAPRPLVLWLTEPDNRWQRVAICNDDGLRRGRDFTIVGFFGQKWPHVDPRPVDAVDDELIRELPEHRHVLSYSTMKRPDGDSCNLVVFDDPDGVRHWRTSALHASAVRMSPAYYKSIRLHNAFCDGSMSLGGRLVMHRTKYYDFRSETPWRGVREFGGGSLTLPIAGAGAV